MILWLIERSSDDMDTHVIVFARDREFAKREAHRLLGGNPDNYVCTPLTRPGDVVFVNLVARFQKD